MIPVTSTFSLASSKDSKLFADLRAGQVLFVEFIVAGRDARLRQAEFGAGALL